MATFNKILLTGINGQVGHALYPKLQSLGEVVALDRSQLDLSKPDHIRDVVRQTKPDLIINPAAYTAVDKAESEPELAYAINGTAPGILAEEAAKLNALLVHYSTDYVFDGTKTTPYTELDETNPLSVYGASKLAGEKAIQEVGANHLIFRTSWVYGAYGKNFMRTILRLAAERDSLNIVADQFGAPTSTESIADATITALHAWDGTQRGVYHLVNTGETSWHGFALEIIRQYGEIAQKKNLAKLKSTVENVVGITTAEYPTPAHRPANSKMSTEKFMSTFKTELAPWELALRSTVTHLATFSVENH
ncbi:dTDP-4-dehydrorhamnose reductase [Methylobacillus flagellatus]|uniref:dTDP-4-dehydrorhamnose reductase n=1 Tax=Methylobacillus flagellatus (strain ATCC 51484 / DSM 6875 / VKM B-1610 / KT) TaxID=265072 RepID=Q1GZQ9_METFK|nr:dTDP-4-dehydrorhamnose reductase [Methylobacillus flagellatus]ABE50278.1 dTDP-4-dehydrorhamnose reductase [Methylobacillus flagellatus KT]